MSGFGKHLLSRWRFAALIILAAILARLPSLFMGFYNPDETCYATIGHRLLEGKLLYVDCIDHKPPLIYWLYAIFSFLGGSQAIIVAHAAVTGFVAATAMALASATRILLDRWDTAILAALLYIVGAGLGKPYDVSAANAELIFNLPLALHILFTLMAIRNSDNARSFALLAAGGLMAGVAILVKQQAGFALPATILFLLTNGGEKFTRRLKQSLTLAAFASVPLLATAIWLYASGRLAEAWYWGVSVNSLYMLGHESGPAMLWRFIKQISYMILAEQSGLWLPIVAYAIFRKRGEKSLPKEGRLIVFWLVASALAVFPGERFFGHYFLQLLPPLCIVSAAAGMKLVDSVQWRRGVTIVWSIVLAIPFLISWVWSLPVERFHPELETTENKALIEYLKQTIEPNEKIEVWGRFNGIPFLVGRDNGTRFLNKNLLTGSFRSENLVKMPDSHWELFMQDLRQNRPEWFIDHSQVDMKNAPPQRFPVLAEYLLANYRLVKEVNGNSIYRRIDTVRGF